MLSHLDESKKHDHFPPLIPLQPQPLPQLLLLIFLHSSTLLSPFSVISLQCLVHAASLRAIWTFSNKRHEEFCARFIEDQLLLIWLNGVVVVVAGVSVVFDGFDGGGALPRRTAASVLVFAACGACGDDRARFIIVVVVGGSLGAMVFAWSRFV